MSQNNNRYIALQFAPLKDNETAVAIKLKKGKNGHAPIKADMSVTNEVMGFLQSKKAYEQYYKAISEGIEDAIPLDVGNNCKKCKPHLFDKSKLPNDPDVKIMGNCDTYRSQMRGTYLLACMEYVRIVKHNWFIYDNKPLLRNLTVKFFQCFGYIKGKGILFFDVQKLCSNMLQAGFLSASQAFEKSDALKNLGIINDTLDSIDEAILKIKLFEQEDYDRLDLQKEFFTNKLRFYKEKAWINLHLPKETIRPHSSNSRPNRTDIAYFCYYTSETKEIKVSKRFPSDEAWIEIGEKYNKNWKNIQLVYNAIRSNNEHRVNESKKKNIEYVIQNMLQDFPLSKTLAEKELNTYK